MRDGDSQEKPFYIRVCTKRTYVYGTLDWNPIGGRPYCNPLLPWDTETKIKCYDYAAKCNESWQKRQK